MFRKQTPMRRTRMKAGPGNPIPQETTDAILLRDKGRCLRCGGVGSERSHRRSRRIRDEHTHCPCNVNLLCHTCHADFIGAQQIEARKSGLLLHSTVAVPAHVPVQTYMGWGLLLCGPEGGLLLFGGVRQIVTGDGTRWRYTDRAWEVVDG